MPVDRSLVAVAGGSAGYVLLHRSLLGHAAFRNESETMAFAWLVMRAAWRPTRVRYKGHSITLQRGQLAISQRDMAAAFDRDKAWIERLWKRLKSEAMIETAAEAGVAVITVCNYAKYQAIADLGEAPAEAAREAENEAGVRQRRGTEQEEKKGITLNARARARLLPDDWEPTEFGKGSQSAAIIGGWTRLTFERELEAFRAHHLSHGTRFTDWQAAWSKWVVNTVRFADRDAARPAAPVHRSAGGNAAGSTLVDQILAEEARRAAGASR